MTDIVEEFNNYFANEGPDLAKQIKDSLSADELVDNLVNINPTSMFLSAVTPN